ncbi:MAG: hypothetical protein ACE5O2_12110 [Armatimonadota bacterium]
MALLASAAFLGGGGVSISLAGEYHESGQLHCSDCHIMHASQRGIGYGGSVLNPPGYPSLLRAATPSELCLTCHDGGGGTGDSAPDVMTAASYETADVKRPAGAFQAPVAVATQNGHDLGVPDEVAPGGTWSSGAQGMSCATCHDPHGNGNYRNLVPRPGTASADLQVTAISESVQTPTSAQYSVANVGYTDSDNGLAEWCRGCHTDFHGPAGDSRLGGSSSGDPAGSDSFWFRHPTRDVTMAEGAANGHIDGDYWFTAAASRVPVVSPSGVIPGTPGSSDNEVFCGSCHKAHGSGHRSALIWDDPSTGAIEDGASATQTCEMCHYL